MKFFVLSGSTRAASVNSRLAHEIGGRLTALGHDVSVHSMADFELPIYSGDLEKETGAPESAQSFRAALESADGLIVVSPEYNFSFPGGLKNLIDWVSRFRPYPFKNVPTPPHRSAATAACGRFAFRSNASAHTFTRRCSRSPEPTRRFPIGSQTKNSPNASTRRSPRSPTIQKRSYRARFYKNSTETHDSPSQNPEQKLILFG